VDAHEDRGNTEHCKSAPAITTFTYHQIVILQLEENGDILTSGSEVIGYKHRMGMLSGTQKHVICFEQGVKCFCEIFLAKRRTTVCFQ